MLCNNGSDHLFLLNRLYNHFFICNTESQTGLTAIDLTHTTRQPLANLVTKILVSCDLGKGDLVLIY